MRSSAKNGNAIGCLVIFILVLVVGLVQSIVRYVQDKPLYTEAHTAYLAGNCDTADPIYDELADKFRFIDFGSIRDKSRNEAIDCSQFRAASEKGIYGLYLYTVDQPNNGLAPFAKNKGIENISSLNDSSDLTAILSNETCAKQDELADAGWLNEEPSITRFLYYCAKMLLAQGSTDDALNRIAVLVQNYPSSEMAGKVRDTLSANSDFCPLLPQMSANSVFNISSEMLPNLYVSCGRNYETANNYDQAVTMYQTFLDMFPEHASAAEVKKMLAAALVAQARASGSGTIEKPNTSGSAPAGVARVVIQNDSPHDLKLVFSGTEALIEELPACAECQDYSMIGPMYCPEKGPIGTYDLAPGQYEVLVETTHEENIIPFTGTWDLEGGKEFYSCFFVVTSYY